MLPIVSAPLALALIVSLQKITILRFIVWLAIGLVICFLYSRSHSGLNAPDAQARREDEYPACAEPTV